MGCNTFISAVNVRHIVKNYGSCSVLTFVSVSEHVKNVSTLVITYAMREDREMCLANSVIIPTPCDLFGIKKGIRICFLTDQRPNKTDQVLDPTCLKVV